MKLTKKKVFVTALAVCLIAILSFGTIAWFTASDEVTNQFKVTTSDEEGTPDFSVDLFEHKVTMCFQVLNWIKTLPLVILVLMISGFV